MMDDAKSQPVEYETDRDVVPNAWLHFLQLRPEVARIGALHKCAHFNGHRRATGEKLVKPTVFYQVLGALARQQAKDPRS